MKSTIFASIALALASAGLAACGEKPATPPTETDGKPGVDVTNGRLVLPAVKGNPAALYFDIVNNSGDEEKVMSIIENALLEVRGEEVELTCAGSNIV